MSLRAILFDFDGTLANTALGIVKTMEQTFLRMGVPVPPEVDMVATIGIPLGQALQQLGNLTDGERQRAVDIYEELFVTYEVGYITLFPQVLETLQTLKERGMRMAIVTSRGKVSLDLIMERHGLTPFFETLVTNDDHLTPKPAPDMVQTLLQRMNLLPDEALVVGDTTFDIEMGNRAGCRTIAVTYGNHSLERLLTAHPTFIVDKFEEILNIGVSYT